jgi:hypothetical protein
MKKCLLVTVIGFVLAAIAAIGAPQPLASPAAPAQAECDCSNLKVLQIELRNALLLQQAAAQHPTASTPAVRSPEIVIKEFYKWYIHDVNGQGSNSPWKTTKGRAILKKYVTLRFIRAIDRNEKLPEDADAFDADYFLLDQDTSGLYGEKYLGNEGCGQRNNSHGYCQLLSRG